MKAKIFLLVLLLMTWMQGNVMASMSSRVEGQVLDKETGEPIPGATVTLHSISEVNVVMFKKLFNWEDKSDEKGNFSFELDSFYVEENGKFLILCKKEGYIPFLPEYYEAKLKPEYREEGYQVFRVGEGMVKHVKIKMSKGGTIKGNIKILGAPDYSPKDISCCLRLDTGKHSFLMDNWYMDFTDQEYIRVKSIKPDANGNFELFGLEPSRFYYIDFFANGYNVSPTDFIQVNAGEVTSFSQTLDFSDKSGIKGNVSVKNHEIAGGSVSVLNWDSKGKLINYCSFSFTNVDGHYFCYGLPAGLYEMHIIVRTNDPKVFTKKVPVQIEQSKTKTMNIELNEGVQY